MSFSTEWDALYKANTNLSIWPWSDLVSIVHRHAKPSNGFTNVLELGCGAGANIPFFISVNANYWSIEGSESIVLALRHRFPDLANKLLIGDFTEEIPVSGPFDLVVDRLSLAHNSTVAIRRTLLMTFNLLRPGGKFIGIDWFSDKHCYATSGELVDANTRTKFPMDSHLANVGLVHFFDREHLIELFESTGFTFEWLEHKQLITEIPPSRPYSGSWNFVAVKP